MQLQLEQYQHQGPLPPPEQLAQYDQVKPGLAGEIVDMAQDALAANIEAQTVPIRAEAKALLVVTYAGAALPYVVILTTIIFAVLGWTPAAIVSGILGVATVGPQLISAYRKSTDSPPDPQT